MLDTGWTEAVALAAACLIATVTTPAGISGAVLLLPFQVSVLGTPSPAVTPTNLLYNIIATPGALYRYWRQGQTGGRLALVLIKLALSAWEFAESVRIMQAEQWCGPLVNSRERPRFPGANGPSPDRERL